MNGQRNSSIDVCLNVFYWCDFFVCFTVRTFFVANYLGTITKDVVVEFQKFEQKHLGS